MTLFADKRAGALIWLAGAAVIAVLGWWYPLAIAERNAAPDDRFGFVLVFPGVPFVFMGSIIAAWSYARLLRALLANADGKGSVACGVLGSFLFLVSLATAVIVLAGFFG